MDGACAFTAGLLAVQVRFAGGNHLPAAYLTFACGLPVLWWISLMVAGGYDARFIGLGSDEFRRVLNAAVSLTAGVAVVSYAAKLELARGYMAVALPSVAVLDLTARYLLRKRLHRLRGHGQCTRRVIAVGHLASVADLVTSLRRDRYHGLAVVAVCLAGEASGSEVEDVPVAGGLDEVTLVVERFAADTVAVLACPEMDGRQ